MPRSWAIGSVSPGRPRRPTVWARSPSSSFASGADRSSIPATAPGSPRSAPASSTTCTLTPGDTVGYAVLSKRGGVESVAAISLGPVRFPGRRQGCAGRVPPSRGRAGLVASARRLRGAGDPQAGRAAQEPSRRRPDSGGPRPRARPQPRSGRGLSLRDLCHLRDARRPAFPRAGGRGLGAAAAADLDARGSPAAGGTERAGSHRLDRAGARLGQDPAHGPAPARIRPAPGCRPARPRRSMAAGSSRPLPIGPSTPSRRPRATAITRRWPSGAIRWTVGHSVALTRVPTRPSCAPPAPAAAWEPLPAGCGVTLRWRWAAEADATLVVARQGTPPQGPDDPAAITATVFRGRLRSVKNAGRSTCRWPTRPGDSIDNAAVALRSGGRATIGSA